MAVDFHKAYDMVKWPALEKVLRLFNFGEQFIKYIKYMSSKH